MFKIVEIIYSKQTTMAWHSYMVIMIQDYIWISLYCDKASVVYSWL